jgi:hypothetical protein
MEIQNKITKFCFKECIGAKFGRYQQRQRSKYILHTDNVNYNDHKKKKTEKNDL